MFLLIKQYSILITIFLTLFICLFWSNLICIISQLADRVNLFNRHSPLRGPGLVHSYLIAKALIWHHYHLLRVFCI